MSTSRYAAVIFDLDGVITDTARYHYLAWKRLADGEGVHFDEAANEHLKGIDRMGSLELILASATRAYSDAEKLALATEKNEHYKELIATMSPADLLPGAVAALDTCRAAGLKIGLASVSRNAFTVLDRLGITDKFDYIVDAGTIAKGKPDPEIFLKAARELGVAPGDCFGVEDAVAGVASIKSAGMYAIGVGDPAVLTEADQVIPDLAAFRIP
ncbi:beta-phosphoglucomutase [Pseudoduganella lurida]|uniref:Beta-phosphoglucomutase n=1 Tax=Pseudoduganella lurida TaxID=1036180 RepID=A0A562R3A1_9BURK|nr:beta-phosphoglucomutase [Pseudoduganella lurida]TWI63034.1 beta-phosphoglucomutase [Pseudoduganella lurida]